jgi:hypothetical protein
VWGRGGRCWNAPWTGGLDRMGHSPLSSAASMGVLVLAVAMTILLARDFPSAAVLGVVLTLGVFAVWFPAYDVWFAGRANVEFVSPMTTLGDDGER